MKTEKLTLQQAIDLGYTHYVDDNDCASSLEDIEDEEDEDFPDGAIILSPKRIQTISVTPREIRDLLEEFLCNRASDIAGENICEMVEATCSGLNCGQFADHINDHFKDIYHYETTNLILTK